MKTPWVKVPGDATDVERDKAIILLFEQVEQLALHLTEAFEAIKAIADKIQADNPVIVPPNQRPH